MRARIRRWLVPLLFAATSGFAVGNPRVYLVGIETCPAGDEDCGPPGTVFFSSPLFIAAGDGVMFFNSPDPNGVLSAHNVVADDGSFRCAEGCDGEGGNGSPSASPWYFTRTFNAAGLVTYHDEVTEATGAISVTAPPASPQAVAVEYYDAAWNMYFVTAFPDEIAALDGGAFGGAWKRTGETFNVWTDPADGLVPTCRFFSATFAPKSSHFYTPYAAECASLMGTVWLYEGIAFYLRLADDDGQCPGGSIPVFPLYNNGMGGAPNHRYTTSFQILYAMENMGWSQEGNGDTETFACVPR
ncbi:MAG TPA: hypothetical protein VMN79_13190 [Casimicrobiaceae bacterium]|nr:hypothetical protein [Casimicrobiaceae bacterium]